jgi:hypothetical protein
MYSVLVEYLKKWVYNWAVHQLFIDVKTAYDTVQREVLYNIVIQFGIPVELIRSVKICLKFKPIRVWVGKRLSDTFPVKRGLEQGDSFCCCFSDA